MHRLALLLVLVAACKRDPNAAPPCGAVGAKFLVIARGELEVATGGSGETIEATRRAVLDQLPAMRDSLVNACTDTAWSDAVRRCLVDAPTHVAFEACLTQLGDEQRRDLDERTRGAAPGR